MNENKTNINWYPGHMVKTKKEIVSIISNIDIVIEVIDSRVPYSSRIPDLGIFTNNKRSILVFNKYDLCDKTETDKWIKKYKNDGCIVVTADSKNSNDYKKIIDEVKKIMISINEIRKKKGLLPKKAKCIVIGVPNVGKSTLINRLIGKNVLDVGNKPGITKKLNTIKINEFMDLVDTPGILWPKFEEEKVALNLACMTIIKEEVLSVEQIGIYVLKMLSKYYKSILFENLGIKKYEDKNLDECFLKISEFKNIPVKDEIDYEKICILIINLIKQAKIKGITFDRM